MSAGWPAISAPRGNVGQLRRSRGSGAHQVRPTGLRGTAHDGSGSCRELLGDTGPGGKSANVIAEPAGFDPRKPHVVVGAHLDTVPSAPGAEDNASGIAVLLQLARMAAQKPAGLPVNSLRSAPKSHADLATRCTISAPAAPGRHGPAERRAVRAMVSLDRVGAGLVCACVLGQCLRTSAPRFRPRSSPSPELTTRPCLNRASDHWSYAKNGIPAVRLGSVPYAGYHSPRDVPSVVDRRQLDRVGRVMWAWLPASSDQGTAKGPRLVLQTSATIRVALPPVTSRGVNSSSMT